MKIFVFLKSQITLSAIRGAINTLNSERAEQIVFTTNHVDVLAGIYTYADEFVVVISDQTTGSGLRAVQLASQIKALHANVIFMVYGINPEYGSSIDILINRITCFYRGAMEHLFLAHVLCSIVEDTTPESLKKQFTSLDLCNA